MITVKEAKSLSTLKLVDLGVSGPDGEQILDALAQNQGNALSHLDLSKNESFWTEKALQSLESLIPRHENLKQANAVLILMTERVPFFYVQSVKRAVSNFARSFEVRH